VHCKVLRTGLTALTADCESSVSDQQPAGAASTAYTQKEPSRSEKMRPASLALPRFAGAVVCRRIGLGNSQHHCQRERGFLHSLSRSTARLGLQRSRMALWTAATLLECWIICHSLAQRGGTSTTSAIHEETIAACELHAYYTHFEVQQCLPEATVSTGCDPAARSRHGLPQVVPAA
jgi:hypothetical protein